tara:strand:+ start:976 stop:1128 length:153 start_codon:yes stop_codon:yes gene_type:complete
MTNWSLEMVFHLPHDRFLVGWEYIEENEEYDYKTIKLFMFFVTFTLNLKL